MGRVYRVRDRQIEGREVALKVLIPRYSKNQQFRTLFFQEIRAAQNFVSENVIQVRDTGQMDDGKLFLTMDLVEGESLRSLVQREGSLAVRQALEVTRQMLLGLQSGHDQGFVHRDIKPSNVMLASRVPKTDENPHGVGVRLLDFGIAGLAAQVGEDVAGTPWYMSPEQTQGQRLDGRSDLFSVGIVFYEMLTGKRPFEGDTVQEITTSVLEDNIAPLIADIENLSAPLQRILKRALQKNRDKRFQSATDFIKAIEGSKAYRLPTEVPGWTMAVAGIAIVAAAGASFFAWQQMGEVDAKDKALTSLRDELNTTRDQRGTAVDELQSRFATREGALNDTIAALRAQIAELETRETREQIDTVEVTGEERDYEKVFADWKSTLSRLQETETKLAETNAKLEELRATQARMTQEGTSEARLANAFDRILGFVNDDVGRSALIEYETLAREGLFSPTRANGSDFVHRLCESAAALATYRDDLAVSEAPDISALRGARKRLEDARALERAFPLEAEEWIAFAVSGDEAPDRLALVTTALTKLEGAIEAEFTAIADRHESAAREFEEGAADQDPAAAFAHAGRYECDHLEKLLVRFLGHLRHDVEGPGTLNLDRLARYEVLARWSEELAAYTGPRLDGDDEIDFFLAAQRWYAAQQGEGFVDASRLATAAQADATPRDDWRVEFSLQTALAQAGSAYPLVPGRSLVYRDIDLRNDLVTWQIEELDDPVPADTQGPWNVRRRIYVEDGTRPVRPQNYDITRRGQVFLQASRPILDLFEHGAAVQTATWSTLSVGRLPTKSYFPPSGEFERFRDELAASPEPCLVIRQGQHVRWFSPTYGLVLEEEPGVYRRELVYVGRTN